MIFNKQVAIVRVKTQIPPAPLEFQQAIILGLPIKPVLPVQNGMLSVFTVQSRYERG
jgi:hypothetical protein